MLLHPLVPASGAQFPASSGEIQRIGRGGDGLRGGMWWGTTKMGFQQLQIIKNEIQRSIPAENLISIILFGSAVTSSKSAQDYDILIVTKELPPHDWILAGEIKFQLLGKVDKPLDIVFMEEQDLEYTSPFVYEVGQRSKLLYGKDMISKLRKASQNIRALTEGGTDSGWQIGSFQVQ